MINELERRAWRGSGCAYQHSGVRSADEALASNEIAAQWIRDNVLEFVKGMPEVMAGNVLVAASR
jgi:hypothetical protein